MLGYIYECRDDQLLKEFKNLLKDFRIKDF